MTDETPEEPSSAELTENEVKLLMIILEEADETRCEAGCIDASREEEAMFTKAERKEIQKSIAENGGWNISEDELDGWLSYPDYTRYIINRMKAIYNRRRDINFSASRKRALEPLFRSTRFRHKTTGEIVTTISIMQMNEYEKLDD